MNPYAQLALALAAVVLMASGQHHINKHFPKDNEQP